MGSLIGTLLLYISGAVLIANVPPSTFMVVGILAVSWAACRLGVSMERWETSRCWDGEDLDPDHNKLPKIGQSVLFHLNSSDSWEVFTVTGYYVWGDLGGNPRLHRVFVQGVDRDGFHNARLLCDIRYPEKTT